MNWIDLHDRITYSRLVVITQTKYIKWFRPMWTDWVPMLISDDDLTKFQYDMSSDDHEELLPHIFEKYVIRTLKSDKDAIKSSSSFVADDACCPEDEFWMICRSNWLLPVYANVRKRNQILDKFVDVDRIIILHYLHTADWLESLVLLSFPGQ